MSVLGKAGTAGRALAIYHCRASGSFCIQFSEALFEGTPITEKVRD